MLSIQITWRFRLHRSEPNTSLALHSWTYVFQNTLKSKPGCKTSACCWHTLITLQFKEFESVWSFGPFYNKNLMLCGLLGCSRQFLTEKDLLYVSTHAAYALLYSPQCKDVYSTCIYTLIWMKIAHPCIEADTEDRMLHAFELLKKLFLFSLPTKSILVAS